MNNPSSKSNNPIPPPPPPPIRIPTDVSNNNDEVDEEEIPVNEEEVESNPTTTSSSSTSTEKSTFSNYNLWGLPGSIGAVLFIIGILLYTTNTDTDSTTGFILIFIGFVIFAISCCCLSYHRKNAQNERINAELDAASIPRDPHILMTHNPYNNPHITNIVDSSDGVTQSINNRTIVPSPMIISKRKQEQLYFNHLGSSYPDSSSSSSSSNHRHIHIPHYTT